MERLHRRRNCWPSIAILLLLARPATAVHPLLIEGIARVGYRVADATKAQAFYSGVLGLQRMDEPGGAALYKVNNQQYV
jgi:hypothetical protein